MPFLKAAVFAAAVLSYTVPAAAQDTQIIHAGTLLAVPGETPLLERSIVIQNAKIAQVLAGYKTGEDLGLEASIIDMTQGYVMPGFIDGHVHLTGQMSPDERMESVELSDADAAVRGTGYARETLLAGFTTVRDVGDPFGDAIFAIRDGINRGDIFGPRILAAGNSLSITGGHGDGSLGFDDDIGPHMEGTGLCDGADECRKAVRTQIRRGADVIKFTATAGVLSNSDAGLEQQFFDDELDAIVTTAHLMGVKATAHAHGAEGIKAALRAGVDSIEHGTFIDAEGIKLMKANGAFLLPTLTTLWSLTPLIEDENSYLLDVQRKKGRIALQSAKEFVRNAHKGGVKVAFGTDAGVFPHGENAKEFELLVNWGGMTPMEAIRSATVIGAQNVGMEESIGQIKPGMMADIVGVMENPLEDITVLQTIAFVMKDGIAIRMP